ncbi:hypothetical protein AF335_23435 [Streptomyces eurocidicus]|uniref:Uncharacterized protein n=2 Tax=Streptomyces eurocidicus TaxID=66423 RepID=A0A2N8NSN3_STREU|nr:hypothetical protein AF335_23435 [Streptomyces eurocidicus]
MTMSAESGGEPVKCKGCERIVLWLDGRAPCGRCGREVSVLLAAPPPPARSTGLVVMGGAMPVYGEDPGPRNE